MNEAATIVKLLGLIKELKQKDLGEECGINKGQLSAYLTKGGSLAEDKQVALIASLVGKLDKLREQGTDLSSEVEALIKDLQTYPPYQVSYGEAAPGSVILPGHKCYVERPQAPFQNIPPRPFVLGITGGPKSGKSTLGRGLQYRLRKERVIFADCRDYVALATQDACSFIRWLVKTAAAQWPGHFSETPGDWRGVVQWLKADVLRGAPCTFIFDHLEALGDAYQEFSSGWHNVLNQSRREPILDDIGLVLLFDEANGKLYNARTAASRVEQRMRIDVARPFPEGALRKLLSVELVSAEEDGAALSAEIWKLFHGHPYLSHCYIHAYGNARPASAGHDAVRAAEAAFSADIAPRLLGNVYQNLLRSFFNARRDDMVEFLATEESHAMLLQDTLLFIELDNGYLRCATPWIQQRLIEFIALNS